MGLPLSARRLWNSPQRKTNRFDSNACQSTVQLDNVPVGHDVAGSDLLTFESGRAPHASMLEGAREILVDEVCNIRDRLPTTQRVRSGAICRFARRFGIDAHDTQVIEEPRADFT